MYRFPPYIHRCNILTHLLLENQLSIAMHGSRKSLLLKEKFMAEIARDPAFHLADIYDLSKDQIRERTMEKFASLVHYVTSEPLDVFNYRMQVRAVFRLSSRSEVGN
jgi:hypothetical protein